jgi:hypothetical protein
MIDPVRTPRRWIYVIMLVLGMIWGIRFVYLVLRP